MKESFKTIVACLLGIAMITYFVTGLYVALGPGADEENAQHLAREYSEKAVEQMKREHRTDLDARDYHAKNIHLYGAYYRVRFGYYFLASDNRVLTTRKKLTPHAVSKIFADTKHWKKGVYTGSLS